MKRRGWTTNKKIDIATDAIGGLAIGAKWGPQDWLHLALACLDQAGCLAQTTDAVEELLYKRGALEDNTD